jgi:hypothetical protein
VIIRFFKSNQQATFIAIPLLVIALWVEGFLKQVPLDLNSAMPIYKLITCFYSIKTDIVYRILAMTLLILQAIYLNNVINKHEVLYRKSHLPAMVYCVLMSLFIPFLNLHPILLLSPLLIIFLDTILSFYKSNSNSMAFNCGLLIGICTLIYFPSIILFLVVLTGLIILRPFYWRNWIVAIIGLILPFYFISIYFFCIDGLGRFWMIEIPGYFVHLIKLDFIFSRPVKLLSVTIAFVLILSLFKLQSNFFKNVIKTRNYQIVLLFYLFLSGTTLLLCTSMRLEDFSILSIPASIFISYYFLSSKRFVWIEVMMFFILFLIIYNQVLFKGN